MKYLILIILCSFSFSGISCSMYKVTEDGKTIVGNNEDWISPNSQFWYELGQEGEYGVMNVGLINNFAQGAINDAGLVFDGFSVSYLEVKNVEGKVSMRIGEVVKNVMHSYDNVRDVQKYLATINLSALSSSQLVFVDKSGEYLIVEGDELILGNEAEKTFSNFYYSQIESIEEVELPNVKNGLNFLKSSEADRSFEYCSAVMNSISNPDNFTQYSTIYDLDKLIIRVYLFHDYNNFIEIDLKKELTKGAHRTMIADLFPSSSVGHQNYLKYNDPNNPTGFIDEFIGNKSREEENLVKNGFAFNINVIGYEWLYDKSDPKGAIQIFKYATELMPNEANLFDSLGEAYLTNKNYNEAKESYTTSLNIDPTNENATKMLERIERESKD